MYNIKTSLEISASHCLSLPYNSPCQNSHGHNWIITLHLKGEEVNAYGMLIDFTTIKKMVKDKMDHKDLNEVFDFNPTAENIARWLVEEIPHCWKAEVEETKGNYASYQV